MTNKIPTASVYETAFPCPHCGAYAKQGWANCLGATVSKIGDKYVPFLPDVEKYRASPDNHSRDPDKKEQFQAALSWAEDMHTGQAFIERSSAHGDYQLHNVFISNCFNCDKPSIWVHESLIYPPARTGEAPHPDLPLDILRDYEEAQSILELSPRGAAALLRLAVQKLCVHLGEPGKNINTDIASLVKKGLDQMTAEALDSVRVIGNEAVHPGQMDLKDDKTTAAELFYVVNFIVEQMITKRKKLAEIYNKLPPAKRAEIDARNAKALKDAG
jgi:hypothetical protein